MKMNDHAKILVVEDQPNEREALQRLLRLKEYDVVTAENSKQAIEHLNEPIQLVISDLRMGGASGVELLRYWKSKRPHTPFIMMTAFAEVGSAVEAMKLGAEDYLSKPVNPEELLLSIEKCFESRRKDETIAHLRERLDDRLDFENIVGQSKQMLEIFRLVRRAAATEAIVLITGESGTGKELIAEAIHQHSPRKDGPFIVVNMAAVPEHLVESELFGHMRGSFTGATESRIGRFEAANRGTIFIDEIGDFKLESQAKLLRVLENRTVNPVGSNNNVEIDVRVVAATSHDLQQMVRDGKFREDLYYRLNVINAHLPPLRERREDIPLLVNHFLQRLCQQGGRPLLSLDPDLKHYLETHDWPGNVRQLRNCLESMVVLAAGDTLTMDDVPATLEHGILSPEHSTSTTGTRLEDLERGAVEQALAQHHGNRTHAARALGISVRTLQRKLKAWGLNNGHGDHHDHHQDGDPHAHPAAHVAAGNGAASH
jgi:DNA-binding NtrC family response regulator